MIVCFAMGMENWNVRSAGERGIFMVRPAQPVKDMVLWFVSGVTVRAL